MQLTTTCESKISLQQRTEWDGAKDVPKKPQLYRGEGIVLNQQPKGNNLTSHGKEQQNNSTGGGGSKWKWKGDWDQAEPIEERMDHLKDIFIFAISIGPTVQHRAAHRKSTYASEEDKVVHAGGWIERICWKHY